jgi:HPt (histidine-containing phosphotransfer) domain-containing protein
VGGALSEAGESDATVVRTRLTELTRKFVTRTAGDVAQMRDALARLGDGQSADALNALAKIHQLAHRACGTGGTLGLCELSDAAADLERLIAACPAGSVPDSEVRAEIAARIDAIAAHL